MREVLSTLCEEERALLSLNCTYLQTVMYRRDYFLQRLEKVRSDILEQLKEAKIELSTLPCDLLLYADQIVALTEEMNLKNRSILKLAEEQSPRWQEMVQGLSITLSPYLPIPIVKKHKNLMALEDR